MLCNLPLVIVYSFPFADVTNDHTSSGLKQHKWILLQFGTSEVQNGFDRLKSMPSAGLCSFWRPQGSIIPFSFPASGSHLHSLAHGPSGNGTTLTSASNVAAPHPSPRLLCSYKDACD